MNQLLCGFHNVHSTQYVLFKMLISWQKELDGSGFIRTILMDLESLVAKLAVYDLNESLHLVSDYLKFQKQRAKITSAYSDWAHVIWGIPKGSLSSPLLFNGFINDIFVVIEKSHICNFADDNTLDSCGSNLLLILSNLEHDMKHLLYEFKINSLKANPGKIINCRLDPWIIKKLMKRSYWEQLLIKTQKTYWKFMPHCQAHTSCLRTNQNILDNR